MCPVSAQGKKQHQHETERSFRPARVELVTEDRARRDSLLAHRLWRLHLCSVHDGIVQPRRSTRFRVVRLPRAHDINAAFSLIRLRLSGGPFLGVRAVVPRGHRSGQPGFHV